MSLSIAAWFWAFDDEVVAGNETSNPEAQMHHLLEATQAVSSDSELDPTIR